MNNFVLACLGSLLNVMCFSGELGVCFVICQDLPSVTLALSRNLMSNPRCDFYEPSSILGFHSKGFLHGDNASTYWLLE